MGKAMTPKVLGPGHFEPAVQQTLYFIGVSTGRSSIMQVFPRWAEFLGISQEIVGIDLAPHSNPDAYREVVQFIKDDPLSLGALVTTHKLDLFDAAEELFDEVGDSARLMKETSCISKSNRGLRADAFDDFTAGLALESFVPPNHFENNDAEVLILGAGGASLALTLYLDRRKKSKNWGPSKVTVTNRSGRRIDEMREFHHSIGSSLDLNLVLADQPELNDSLVGSLPEGSVVVNATGLGKDGPGSPLTQNVLFPQNGFAWDFNYRGELVFLDQANAQRDSRGLTVEDGWVYFLHGWTRVIDKVFDVRIPSSGVEFDRLSQIARNQ